MVLEAPNRNTMCFLSAYRLGWRLFVRDIVRTSKKQRIFLAIFACFLGLCVLVMLCSTQTIVELLIAMGTIALAAMISPPSYGWVCSPFERKYPINSFIFFVLLVFVGIILQALELYAL